MFGCRMKRSGLLSHLTEITCSRARPSRNPLAPPPSPLPRLDGTLSVLVILVIIGSLDTRSAVAQFDMTGRWTEYVPDLSMVNCTDYVQSGTVLTRTACDMSGPQTGVIDPMTGAFTFVGPPSQFCPALPTFVFDGQLAPDGLSYEGTLRVYATPSSCFYGGAFFSVYGVRQRCGDLYVDPDSGEQCDDGNTLNGDCCSSTCQFESGSCDDNNACTTNDACNSGTCTGTPGPDGLPCDDGSVCTSNDTCFAGGCSGMPVTCPACLSCNSTLGCVPTPDTGCKQAGKSSIRLEADDQGLLWRWLRGDLTSQQDLGNPLSTTDYSLCIYDGVDQNGSPRLLLQAAAPAGSSWTANASGFTYKSNDGLPNGIIDIRLKPASQSRAKVIVRGKGSNLNLPPLQSIQLPMRVQLKAGSGLACWESTYSSATTGTERLFRAKSP